MGGWVGRGDQGSRNDLLDFMGVWVGGRMNCFHNSLPVLSLLSPLPTHPPTHPPLL